MLLLTSTSDLITVVTGSAGSIMVEAAWLDNASGTITPGRTNTPAIATAATTTVVAAPASSVQRNVKRLSVFNNSGSVANLVTINHTDGTTVEPLWTGTLAIGESVVMDADGNFKYMDAVGQQKVNQAIPATAWAVPGTLGSTTPNTAAVTTLTATGAVTLSPANLAVAISPTGTGTVAISPVGALTVNPTAASTINNTSVGATTRASVAGTFGGFGQAVLATAFGAFAAGTTTVAAWIAAAGVLLTTALAGAFENDGIAPYFTTNTSDGRGILALLQQFRLTANGSAFNTITNFFGTTSNISLVASAYYEIDIELYFTKTTAEAVTWTFTNSAAPTSMNIHYEQSPITGIVAPGSTAVANLSGDLVNSTTAAQTIVTGSLTTAVNHYMRCRIFLKNGTGTSLKIQAACTTASGITPLLGSRWTSRRIPTANTGAFAA